MSSTVGRPAFILIVAIIVASGVALTLRSLDARRAPPIVIADIAAERPVVVVIDGAVATPGVLTLPPGARLNDAIERAGGFTLVADSNDLNLARLLVDGERVTVAEVATATVDPTTASPTPPRTPTSGEPAQLASSPLPTATAPSLRPTPTPPATTAGTALVDINTATAAELDGLPGIGPVLAERIIAYRNDNGPYGSVEELEAVDGISMNTVEELRPLITTGTGAP